MKRIFIFCCLCLLVASAVNSQVLDPTFGGGYGYILPAPSTGNTDFEQLQSLLKQDDGKIILYVKDGDVNSDGAKGIIKYCP